MIVMIQTEQHKERQTLAKQKELTSKLNPSLVIILV